MKAILIDPYEQTIKQVDYNGDFRQIYDLIEVDTFDVARINNGDGIFVDDNGLYNAPTHFFEHADYPQPLAGKGLIIGCDAEGESVDCVSTLDDTIAKVRFSNIFEIRARYAA